MGMEIMSDPQLAAQMIQPGRPHFVCVGYRRNQRRRYIPPDRHPLNDIHAGEIEQAPLPSSRPDMVRWTKRWMRPYSSAAIHMGLEFFRHRLPVCTHRKNLKSGVMGAPARPLPKGQQMWDIMVNHLVKFIEDIKVVNWRICINVLSTERGTA